MNKYQPALYGGLFIGVLSALPVVSLGNCCCCLWVVGGGVLAAYLLQQRMPEPLQTSDAAVAGVVAGLTGALVAFVIGLMLMPIEGAYQQQVMSWVAERLKQMPNIPPESIAQIDQLATNQPARTFASHFFFFLIAIPVDAIFAMLGGLLGVAMFRKKAAPAAPTTPTM